MLIDRETIDIYIEETNQSLAEIENNLITLENMGANIDMSLAKYVYHAMHVIRNGASLLSLSKIKELSQKIENVLGLICNTRLTPNPEVINILLQGIDRLYQLIDLIHSNDDMDIGEQSVLLTGLTSAVLPDNIKQSVTEVRDIPVPDSKHVFHITEFNLIQVLEQGKNIYILIYDLIKDVQEKNNTPLNFLRFLQEHGDIVDSFFDIHSIGTLEEKKFGSEMPYFVLFASKFNFEQLADAIGVQPHQIKQIKSTIADLVDSEKKLDQPEFSVSFSTHQRHLNIKNRLNMLNSLFCEFQFTMDCFSQNRDHQLSMDKARLKSVLTSLGAFLNQENSVLASKILWKIGRNIRDHAYQSNIQAMLNLQCGLIMMDHRILHRLIDPLTTIILKMVRLVQTETPIQITLNASKNQDMVHFTLSFSRPQILTKEIRMDYHVEKNKIKALCANISQSFDLKKGMTIDICIPQHVFILPGYAVVIDTQTYIVPTFNVKNCLTNLTPSMWCEKDSCIALNHEEKYIQVIGINNSTLSYFQEKTSLMICEVGGQRFGLAIDSRDASEYDAVCQPFSNQLHSNSFIAANCLLEDGRIAMIPDMGFLANKLKQ